MSEKLRLRGLTNTNPEVFQKKFGILPSDPQAQDTVYMVINELYNTANFMTMSGMANISETILQESENLAIEFGFKTYKLDDVDY